MTEDESLSRSDDESMAGSVLTAHSSLPTPPLSRDSLGCLPFEALGSDQVGLDMKKPSQSAKQRRRLNRACASSGDATAEQRKATQAGHSLSRQSLPDLRTFRGLLPRPLSSALDHAWAPQTLQRFFSERGRGSSSSAFSFDSGGRCGLARRPRRWTVPSKSRPTHHVC